MLMGAQDQAQATNNNIEKKKKSKVDQQSFSPLCRLCEERAETVSHVVVECKMLEDKQCPLWQHDRQCGFSLGDTEMAWISYWNQMV